METFRVDHPQTVHPRGIPCLLYTELLYFAYSRWFLVVQVPVDVIVEAVLYLFNVIMDILEEIH